MLELVVAIAAGYAGYLVSEYKSKIVSLFRGGVAEGSALAKLAAVSVKLEETKALAAAKKVEIVAVHATVDELSKLIG